MPITEAPGFRKTSYAARQVLNVPSRSMSITALNPFADMPAPDAGKLPAAQQDVDFAQFLARLLDRGLQGSVIAHIERGGRRETSRGPDRRRGRVQLFLLAPDENDLRAVLGEPFRHLLPDSAAASRYERDFIF